MPSPALRPSAWHTRMTSALNEDASVGDQRGGEPFGLADRCWRAEHRTASLPALDPIRGVRARLRCCCPTPGPEVYRDGYRPSVPRTATRGRGTLPPSGNSAPLSFSDGGAVLRQTFGVRVSWTYCWSTSGPTGHRAECTAPCFPRARQRWSCTLYQYRRGSLVS